MSLESNRGLRPAKIEVHIVYNVLHAHNDIFAGNSKSKDRDLVIFERSKT